MTQFKRARVSDGTNGAAACEHHSQSELVCRFVEERAIELPSNIGRVSAIAAWSVGRFESDTHTEKGQNPLVAVGTNTGCIALVRTADDSVTVLDHGSSGDSTSDNEAAAIQRILMDKSAAAPTCTPDTTEPLPDMVAGDADGRISVFTHGRLFSRATLPAAVSALAADTNPHMPRSYLAGDMGGSVTSYHTQEVRWRVQIDPSPASGLLPDRDDPQITGICAVQWADDAGIATHYVLAATGSQIQVLCHGALVLSMPLHSRCTAMCAGNFVGSQEAGGTQAIVGDDAGHLYVLDRFTLILYARLAHPITRIAVIPHRALSPVDGPDLVFCSTQSNHVYLLCAGKTIGTYVCSSWPVDVAVIESLSPERSRPVLIVAEAVRSFVVSSRDLISPTALPKVMLHTKGHTVSRIHAAVALQQLLENAKQLEELFLSTEPQQVLIPRGLAFRAQISTEKQSDYKRAVTRPRYLQGIHRRLTEMLRRQQPVPLDDIAVVQCGVSSTPQRNIILRGCKGIGKSYLLHLTAAQLLVRDRSVRVVYIANCGDWRSCIGVAQRSVFLAEAIAAAFADSNEVCEMIDMWIRQVVHQDPCDDCPLLVSLLNEIDAYCQNNSIKIAVFLDCIDAIVGPEPDTQDIVTTLVFIHRRYQYAMLLAASDDAKAQILSERLNAGDLNITSPFSSIEASLFIETCELGARVQAPQLKQMLKHTWHHPAELKRLCMLIRRQVTMAGHSDLETVVQRCIQKFSHTPFSKFAPTPFAAFVSQTQALADTFAQAVMDTLMMNSYIGGLVDTNYMVLTAASHQPAFMYPGPQIAKGMVERHCQALGDTHQSQDYYLARMHAALYQRLL
ncbi:hypothetical protein EV175_003865 [Coemansia sp. RSA 1933]|nr:hypothetical protein EV175_003865 [Coemansia sp. RSA 1933]